MTAEAEELPVDYAGQQNINFRVQTCLNPSLVISRQNPTEEKGWSRKQKRAYHRIMSMLTYWRSFNHAVLWITLTSSEKSDPKKLSYHFQILKQRIERKYGFSRLEHVNIRTSEGNGVYHTFLAYKLPNGWRPYRFYIPQKWLSDAWKDIHGAEVVWIERVKKGYKSHKRLSGYAVSQYCAGQSKFERLSWSWKRSLGGALVKTWKKLLKLSENGKETLDFWNKLLSGQKIELGTVFTRYIFEPPPHLGVIKIPRDEPDLHDSLLQSLNIAPFN
jgi:hypothetical protein